MLKYLVNRLAAIVPTMLYDLLVGGMVSSALVPVFSEYAAPERREELWRLAGLLLGRLGTTDDMRKDMEEVKKAADRASGLTRQLLSFSRRQFIAAKVVDLNALVAEIVDLLQPPTHIAVKVSLPWGRNNHRRCTPQCTA